MKARDAARLSALRMVKAALMNGEVSKGRPLEEAEAQQVLASLIKQRRDSIEQFRNGGRDRTWSTRKPRRSRSSRSTRRRRASAAETRTGGRRRDQGDRRDRGRRTWAV